MYIIPHTYNLPFFIIHYECYFANYFILRTTVEMYSETSSLLPQIKKF